MRKYSTQLVLSVATNKSVGTGRKDGALGNMVQG